MALVLAHRVGEGTEFRHKGNLVAKLTVRDLEKGKVRWVSFSFTNFTKIQEKEYSIKEEEKVNLMKNVEIFIGFDSKYTKKDQIELCYNAPKYLKISRFYPS